MDLYHNSQDKKFRDPFGAVICGSEITLRFAVNNAPSPPDVFLRIWTDSEGEKLFPMQQDGEYGLIIYSASIALPEKPQLLWYSFIIRCKNDTVYYGNRPDNLGGEGQEYSALPPSYQITVYSPYEAPEWYRSSIAYQIFPDRFNRGDDWIERTSDCLRRDENRSGPCRILRQSWSDSPRYGKDRHGSITHWDFFGGTLKGITEKLGYLESLGIGTIYLNPIFESSSNHRYDTADYTKIDPRLGDEESFRELCCEAEKRGIYIILDGVFNHAGDDSVYFDRYGNYGSHGAWARPDSPYSSWFKFADSENREYESWWGVSDLPAFNKDEPEYKNFIYGGRDSIIRRWIDLGARGWRLDVADELPDEFIKGIKSAITSTGTDSVLLGEVWEDASNKISYGSLRPYLLGDELDSVMNYPLRSAFIDFLKGRSSSQYISRRIMSLFENYPRPAFYANFNIIGSHDRIRILTLLGSDADEDNPDIKNSPESHLSDSGNYDLALKRLWLLTLLQMTMPGVPCIYYGDEAGMQGGADPYNRGTFPWGHEDKNASAIYRSAVSLRKEWSVFTDGEFLVIPFDSSDVFGFKRYNDKDEVYVLINRCPYHGERIVLPVSCTSVLELLSGRPIQTPDGVLTSELPAFGAMVIKVDSRPLGAPVANRSSGVLCHITSLPSQWGMGQLGEETRDFVLKLAAAGQKYWQILPLNPIDSFDSPYATASAFAGNEYLIDPSGLSDMSLLMPSDIHSAMAEIADLASKGDTSGIKRIKRGLLKAAFKNFKPDKKYDFFCTENSHWLDNYALFMALKEKNDGAPWQEWPEKYRSPASPACREDDLSRLADFYKFCQYIFHIQWAELRRFANENGIKIIGDLPFYVGGDSADVWAEQELFCLDADGYDKVTAGVPPDYFSTDGQIWNNPLYNWRKMEQEGYSWWLGRLEQALERYDLLRLDHFRGFEQYWEIPKGQKSHTGRWKFGPGIRLFEAAFNRFGPLPIIAEDLGEITAQVKNLVHVCGFNSMDVFQFSYHERYSNGVYSASPNAVLYSGTHDNQTLLGWCGTHGADIAACPCSDSADPAAPGTHVSPDGIIRALYASDAPLVILPVQDILKLGDESRMNTPGSCRGNWHWQFNKGDITKEHITALHKLTRDSGRL